MDLIEYDRVSRIGSRDTTSESFRTVKQQRAACRAIVKLTDGARIIDKVEALNASGGKDWPEPKLAEVIARVDAGEADGIVVYSLDRFGRHLRALEVIERWAEEGKVFLSAQEKLDCSTPTGRFALRMMMLVARFYFEQAKARFEVSQRDAVRAGRFVGPTPFGYQRVKGCLVEHPRLGKIVRQAYRVCATDGIHAAVDYLNKTIPGRAWTTDSARKMLASRVYLGESWNWTRENGTRTRHVNPDSHQPLTTPEDFEAAQTAPRARRTNGEYPLTGIGRCGRCGGRLVGQLQNVRGRTYRRYRCGSCAGCSIGADVLEDLVHERMARALSVKRIRDVFTPGGVGDARDRLERAERELRAYLTNPSLSALGDAFTAGAEARARKVDEAQTAFRTVAGETARSVVLPAAGELVKPAQFDRALRVMIDHVHVTPGRGLTVRERVTIVPRVLDDKAVARAFAA